MLSRANKLLITGLPGCGKTTAVMKVAEALRGSLKSAGFYTEEFREGGRRVGFKWNTFDGREGILAHVDIESNRRVGKYGVNVVEFEREVVPLLDASESQAEIYIIDEIGKMELKSNKFEVAIRQLFDSERSVLATIAKKGKGIITRLKDSADTEVYELTRDNRDEVTRRIINLLQSSVS